MEESQMDGVQPLGIYIISGVLYLLPIGFIVAAWRSAVNRGAEERTPSWRTNCLFTALILSVVATLASMSFFFSWLLCDGMIHGMEPSPGLWKTLRPVFLSTFLLSVVLTISGKGKGRYKLFGWAGSMVFIHFVVPILAMD